MPSVFPLLLLVRRGFSRALRLSGWAAASMGWEEVRWGGVSGVLSVPRLFHRAGLGLLAMLGAGEDTDLGAHLFGFVSGLMLGMGTGFAATRIRSAGAHCRWRNVCSGCQSACFGMVLRRGGVPRVSVVDVDNEFDYQCEVQVSEYVIEMKDVCCSSMIWWCLRTSILPLSRMIFWP